MNELSEAVGFVYLGQGLSEVSVHKGETRNGVVDLFVGNFILLVFAFHVDDMLAQVFSKIIEFYTF